MTEHRKQYTQTLLRWGRITAALQQVTDDVDALSQDPVVFKSTGLSTGTCTYSAVMLREKLGGTVVGYHHDMNPTALAGEAEGGHDFLVLPDYIVDWWLNDSYGAGSFSALEDRKVYRSTYHRLLDADLIKKVYGDPATWESTAHGGLFKE
jgi:hypothetical protein